MQVAAQSSVYHWEQIGSALHLQRGEWLNAHFNISLGTGEAAQRLATLCCDLTQANLGLMQDFDIANGYEGIARAPGLIGKVEEAKHYYEKACEAGEAIADEKDRGIFMGDFEAGEWFSVS